MQVNYYAKYLKYKQKYLDLKKVTVDVGIGATVVPVKLNPELTKIWTATKTCFIGPHKKGVSNPVLETACKEARDGLNNKEWLKSPALKAFASPPSDASPVTSHSALKEINAAAKLQGRKTTQL